MKTFFIPILDIAIKVFWIGFNDIANEGAFVWFDGTNLTTQIGDQANQIIPNILVLVKIAHLKLKRQGFGMTSHAIGNSTVLLVKRSACKLTRLL